MPNKESNQSGSIGDLISASSPDEPDFGDQEMDCGYLSDDQEMRLRTLAPVCCRICTRLIARKSILSGKPVVLCGRITEETETADVLNNLLLNTARRYGECHEMRPMRALLKLGETEHVASL